MDSSSSPSPQVDRSIEASREKILRAIGSPPDLTFIRGYGNIGDQLIYAGTRQLLAGLCWREASILQLDGVEGHTAIVSGGGAWCLPYHDMPQYLTRLESQFRRVIILPSSFDVAEPSVRDAIARTKAMVFTRERKSFAQIRALCQADLAHDCAFFFDYEPYRQPGEGHLFAYREDREAAEEPIPAGNCDLSTACESLDEWLWRIAHCAEVYTDRAHVMIAAAMLGKRVRFRASSYHKVPAIAEYALGDYPVRRMAAPVRPVDDESTVREALLHTANESVKLLPDDFVAQHRRPVVTAVVLSWHRPEQTLRAVESLRQHARVPFRVLLVDNHSDAKTRAAIQALSDEHDFVELHLLPENLGCAGGRNLAVDHVATDYLLLLDNDVEVFPGTLEHLLWQMELHPDAVAVTGRVIFPNGRVHLCGADYHTKDGLLHYELLGFGQHYTEPPGVTSVCRWVPGCLTLVRTAVMREQRYDLGMRNYYEDVEWCYRLNEQERGKFYRCVESIGLHHHEVKGADVASTADASHKEAMHYIEAIAHFHAVHGQIIPNLFAFVPELGAIENPHSVDAARLLLTLVQHCGGEWTLRQWNAGRLRPLLHASEIALQQSRECEALRSQLKQRISEIDEIHRSKVWKAISLYRRLRNAL